MTRFGSVFMFTVGLATACAAHAASDPLVGNWKLNPAKSQFTGHTIRFDKGSGDSMKYSADGLTYTFRLDGKEVSALFGRTAIWKETDDHHWETTHMLKGKVTSTDSLTLSPDGQTLTIVSKGTRPDGVQFEDTEVYARESGSGLSGKWRSKEVKISQPELVEFSMKDDGTFMYTVPATKTSWTGKMDGADHPVMGERVPPGMTVSMKKSGPRSCEYMVKVNGKPLYQGTFTVSEDGNVMTEKGRPAAVDEPYTAVYDRQ